MRCVCALLLLMPGLVPGLAWAQKTAAAVDAMDDEGIILVVGQKEAPITLAPRGLSISLGKEEFEGINALDVEDLMKYAPDFFVRKRFAGDDNAVVALRGANTIQSARTIVLVDGFLVSNFLGNRWDFPPKWNVVGPAEVRQFDVVYGPYSARYGGNSIGGVISVTTQESRETSAYATVQAMVMPFSEYGFDEAFAGYSVESGFNWKPSEGPWSARASFRHFHNTGQSMTYGLLAPATGSGTPVSGAFDDPRLASPVFGAASPVDVTQDQARLRIGYEAPGGWRIDALGMAWRTRQRLADPRTWLADAATGAPVYQGRVVLGDKTWNAAGLTLSRADRMEYLAGLKLAGPLAGWDLALHISRYWIARQDSRTSNDYLTGVRDGAGTRTRAGTPGWYSGNLVIERRIGAHRLAFGADGSLYETSTETFSTTAWRDAGSPAFNSATYGKTSLWGVWLEDAVELGGGWVVTGGIRYDRWRAFGGGIAKVFGGVRQDDRHPDRSDASISPKFSIQGPLAADLDIQLSLGTATRFPTVGELFQGRFDDITRTIDPQSFDPNLQAEHSQDANLILRYQAGRLRLTGSLFYQSVDDAILSFSGLNQFGTVVTSYKNIDRVRQYGVELIAQATDVLPGLDLDANLSWISAKTVKNAANPAAEGVQFPRIPKWRSNGNLRYRIADRLKLSVGWRFASRPNSDLFGLERGDAYGFQSEYFTVDTRLSWDMTGAIQLSAGIDNLFNDKAYVVHPLPQRTFVVDLKAKW